MRVREVIYTRKICDKCQEYGVEHHKDLLATCLHKLQHFSSLVILTLKTEAAIRSEKLAAKGFTVQNVNLYKHRREYLQPYISNLTYITAM